MNIEATAYRLLYPFAKIYWRIFRPKTLGAGCVIEFDGKLLMIRHTYGDSASWSFPGGGSKKGEEPSRTAIRETREEVGVMVRDPEELGSFVMRMNGREDTVYAFYARSDSADFRTDEGEILEAAWVERDEVTNRKLSKVGQEMYALYLEKQKTR